MTDEIHCPHCNSTNWRCWDERTELFKDKNGELYEAPVGYLECRDCGKAYINHDENNEHIGADIDVW